MFNINDIISAGCNKMESQVRFLSFKFNLFALLTPSFSRINKDNSPYFPRLSYRLLSPSAQGMLFFSVG